MTIPTEECPSSCKQVGTSPKLSGGCDAVEIQQVLQRYFEALDEKEYGLLDTVFSDGAGLVYDMGSPVEDTYPAMLESFRSFNTRFRTTQHLMGHPRIELDGDRARATTSVRAFHVQEARDGTSPTWVVYGSYRDELVRGASGWRIQQRHFRAVHVEGSLLPLDQVRAHERPPWHPR
jgi:hypothetical protein